MRNITIGLIALAAGLAMAMVPLSMADAAGDGGTGSGGATPGSNVSGDPKLMAGQRALDAGDWQGAVENFEHAIEAGSPTANAYNLLAYSYRRLGQLDLAFTNYARALELNPRHRGTHEYIGEAYLLIGNPAKATLHLSALKDICGNCSEAMKLRKALARHKRTAQSSMLAPEGEDW